MRHAYLIIAHHEFVVLQRLIDLLDDVRNDIYIHFDKKVKDIPVLTCTYSQLHIVENRIDVRWGHVSQIESEYALFEAVYRSGKPYARYHLISGTHLPLKTQDDIHVFFSHHADKEILSPIATDHYEIDFKLHRYHFFIRNYKHPNTVMSRFFQFVWHVLLKIQYKLHIKRPKLKVSTKANNWVSLTSAALIYILHQKNDVLELFERSFCGDEFFVPYLLESADRKFNVMNYPHLLFNDFENDNPRVLKDSDYKFLVQSDYLFARKFSEKEKTIVEKLCTHLQNPLDTTK